MSTNSEITFERMYIDAALAIIAGRKERLVVKDFVQRGVASQVAEQVVAEVCNAKKIAARQEALKALNNGLSFLVVGATITGLAYAITEPGSSFFIATGVFISGSLNVARGAFKWMRQ